MQTTLEQDILVRPTPNPNALKFICPTLVKLEGKTNYTHPDQAASNPMARALFDLRGVDQIHFFQNVITVSKFSFEPWDELEGRVLELLVQKLPQHDPEFEEHDPEKKRRENLPEDLKAIEEILDKRIRPGLQGDGGDLRTVSYQDKVLLVRYEGACGSCPSSTAGTLEAIKGILRDEYDPELDVYIAPDQDLDQF